MWIRSCLIGASLVVAACGKSSKEGSAGKTESTTKAGSAAPAAGSAAAPAASGVEESLRLASTGKKPYNDKQILKTAVVSTWQAGEADGKKHEELIASVTVYDPSNRKCWAWNKVAYRRFPPATDVVQHKVSYEDADIKEVGCDTVGFKPPPAPKKKTNSSGCRGGEVVCGANCTNLQTDRMNCGGCGNECTGDKFACNNGQCW
jgi:hypothetical protein